MWQLTSWNGQLCKVYIFIVYLYTGCYSQLQIISMCKNKLKWCFYSSKYVVFFWCLYMVLGVQNLHSFPDRFLFREVWRMWWWSTWNFNFWSETFTQIFHLILRHCCRARSNFMVKVQATSFKHFHITMALHPNNTVGLLPDLVQ